MIDDISEQHLAKVIFLGDTNVGKSSIIYKQSELDADPLPTIGCSKHVITVGEQRLDLVDTAGQERFRSMTQIYYRDADIALFIFDITCRSSFVNLKSFQKTLDELNVTNVAVVLVANKIDLPGHEVNEEEIKNYANELNCKYYLTSAKVGTGIKDLFEYVAEIARKRIIKEDYDKIILKPEDDNKQKGDNRQCC